MRGREGQPGRVERGTGITPAYAGKSRPAVIIAGHFRDHPRVCGEERKRKKLTGWQRGSPPRMRGRGAYYARVHGYRRITPAYAGKSRKWEKCRPGLGDHPRVCGEETPWWPLAQTLWGSPPRMRGRASVFAVSSSLSGITPAYAGKSFHWIITTPHSGDHPRVCGEEVRPWSSRGLDRGSPPRMRGRVSRLSQLMAETGITPAYAGKRDRCPPV